MPRAAASSISAGAEVVQVVEVHDVGAHAVEQRGERARDRRVVELAVGVAEVEQAVRAVVHADQTHAVLHRLPHPVGRRASRRPTAAWKTVTS